MPSVATALKNGTLTQRQVIDLLYSKSLKKLRSLENGNTEALMQAYKRAQDEIIGKIVNSFGSAETWTLQEWEASGRLRDLLGAVNRVVDDLNLKMTGMVSNSSTVHFVQSYDRTAWAMDQATPAISPIRYAPPPETAIKILANTPYKGAMFSQRFQYISDAMASDIRDSLTQSLIQGEGIGQAAKRVQKVMGLGRLKDPKSFAARAKTIAQSEIMRAQNMAMDELYTQNKDLLQDDGDTEWLVTPDDKLCPWCARREGLSDAEIEAADPGKDPWGRSTDIPLHPNCRCVKVPRLKSWKDLIGLDMPETMQNDVRGMRNPDTGKWQIQPMESFDKWILKRAA